MKALFIGGTGLISTAVSKLALQRGWELTLLNRGKHINDLPEGAEIITVDINDDEAVKKVVEGRHYDVVAEWRSSLSAWRGMLRFSAANANSIS